MQLALLALTLPFPSQAVDIQQDVVSFSISNTPDRFSAVYHDEAADGTHWLRGRNYKASASADGFTFHPFLGSDAPRNFPVGFRLKEAACGGERLSLAPTGTVTRTEDRIAIDRGAVQVRYDATPDHVEQSFLLDAPGGSGPLTLTLEVETDLVVSEQAGGAFRFSNELGGMNYGAAIAIDAKGREVHVPATWTEGELQMTVPAAFLADAESPILVDPLFSTFSLSSSAASVGSPDLIYAGSQGTTLLYEESFSASDVDIYTVLVLPNGNVSMGAYVEQSSSSWRHPRVAATSSAYSLLFVAESQSAAFPASKDIVARARRQDGTFDPPFILKSATMDYSCVAPAIAGDLYYQGFGFCLVYNRDYGTYRDVHALLTQGTATWSGTDRVIAASTTDDASAPSISRATSIYFDVFWVIAWAERNLATGASRVLSSRIRYDGNDLSGPRTVAAATTSALYFDVEVSDRTDFFPLDGNRYYYAITYDDRPSNESDAFVVLTNGASMFDTVELQVAEHVDRSLNQDDVVAAACEGHLMLGYLEGGSLYVTTVEPTADTFGILERRLRVAGPDIVSGSLAAIGPTPTTPGFASGKSLFVWTDESGPSTEIRGAYVTLPTERYAGGEQYCYGEPNSTGERGFLHALGSRIPGFDHRLRVESLPPNNFGYFLASQSRAVIPGAGGSQGVLCVSGSVGRFGIFQVGPDGTFVRTLDTDQIPQPTGPAVALSGEVWNFQCWHRDSVSGMATSNFTNATSIRFR